MPIPIAITEAILLADSDLTRDIGVIVWTAMHEVDRLYNHDKKRASHYRYLIAPEIPSLLASRIDQDKFIQLPEESAEAVWTKARGRYRGSVDQVALLEGIRELMGAVGAASQNLIVVTDREITPPPDFKYLVWDSTPDGWVVSISPIDPLYWGIDDPDRLATLKRRVRAACGTVVGLCLGFERCDNEQCFLFSSVDSVLRLDLMRTLGTEHKDVGTGRALGYPVESPDPGAEQEVSSGDALDIEGWAPT